MGGFFNGLLESATTPRGRSLDLRLGKRAWICFAAGMISLYLAAHLIRGQQTENERKRLLDSIAHERMKPSD